MTSEGIFLGFCKENEAPVSLIADIWLNNAI